MATLNGQTIEEILETIKTMSDEEKEQLKNNLRENLLNKNDFIDQMETLNKPTQDAFTLELLILLSLITIIILIFVFFGYKLYKSLSERERRREEKRRQKQQKKKK